MIFGIVSPSPQSIYLNCSVIFSDNKKTLRYNYLRVIYQNLCYINKIKLKIIPKLLLAIPPVNFVNFLYCTNFHLMLEYKHKMNLKFQHSVSW